MVASGAKGGAIVNMRRGLMDAGLAPKDDRWLSRYNDIPRSVSTAQEKFRPAPPPTTIAPETGEITPDKPLLTAVHELLVAGVIESQHCVTAAWRKGAADRGRGAGRGSPGPR